LRIRLSAQSVAKQETVLTTKTPPTPISGISAPAIAGPTSAAPVKLTELRETADVN
jgi:hypothetical protein